MSYFLTSRSSSTISRLSTFCFQATCSASAAWNSGITSLAKSSSESQMSWWLVLPAWFNRITWSTRRRVDVADFRAALRGRADQARFQRLLLLRPALPALVLLPEIGRARRVDAFAAVIRQREDEEGPARRLGLGLCVGRCAHEARHHLHVGIARIVGELLRVV